MKYPAIFLSLVGMAFASQAQQAPEARAPSGKPDASNAQQVASPNRTSSRTWAASNKGGKHRQQGERGETGDRGGRGDAIIWVDSTGKPVGRAIGNSAILTTFDNQLATITGLYPDQTCDANRVCTYPSNGARWSEFESVYYTTPDCTGIPYSLSAAMGTPYLSVPVVDSGGAYLYFFKAVDTTRVTLRSNYSNNACCVIGIRGAFPTDAAPVSDVVPASTYGMPPFFLK